MTDQNQIDIERELFEAWFTKHGAGMYKHSAEAGYLAGRASMPAIPTGWQPIETAPEHGYIYVQQAATYRWLPYKPNSQEWKRGKKGRWQKHTGYGFDNAELEGTGWMPVPPTPPQGEPS